MDYAKILNEKQLEAVTSTSKYLRIIAGAGSGKTRVLTFRISYLIEKFNVYPNQILAITFTNKAAEEIKNRVEKSLNQPNLNLKIFTFHSFCARILREDIRLINYPSSFNIIDDDDQKKILKNVFEKLSIDSKKITISSMLNYIANKKNSFTSPEAALNDSVNDYFLHQRAQIYDEYEKKLRSGFYLDFDDLLLKTIEIFDKFPDVLKKWQSRLEHVLVDEFQDVDDVQYLFLKLLVGKKLSLYVVGDPDQTIYTWRGANIDIILHFEKDFPGTQTISLTENYSTTKKILAIANKLINNNFNRLKKDLFTNLSEGEDIHIYRGSNATDEADYVVNNIKDLYDNQTVFYKDCAILYRQNSQTVDLERALISYNIPYVIYGAIKFFSRKEIKDVLSYLRLGVNLDDDISLLRIINSPKRGIGDTTIKKLQAFADTENISIFNFLNIHYENLTSLFKNKGLKNFVDQILELHQKLIDRPSLADEILYDYLRNKGYIDELISQEEDERIDNIKELINQLKTHLEKEENSITTFLQDVALYSAQDDIKDNNKDSVKLMTVHTAKGMEFDNVFVYGLVDGIFPSIRAIHEKVDGLEEERRIFYVALTRAKKRLFLSTSGGFSYQGERFESRFLKEIKETVKKNKLEVKNDSLSTFEDNKNIHNGTIINHKVFGEGVVLNCYDGMIDVVFKDHKVGKKTLIANHPTITIVK